MEELGDVVKRLREAKKMSLYRLAKEAGLSYTTVWRIENGKTRDPKRRVLSRLSEALGVSLEWFREREDEPT